MQHITVFLFKSIALYISVTVPVAGIYRAQMSMSIVKFYGAESQSISNALSVFIKLKIVLRFK